MPTFTVPNFITKPIISIFSKLLGKTIQITFEDLPTSQWHVLDFIRTEE